MGGDKEATVGNGLVRGLWVWESDYHNGRGTRDHDDDSEFARKVGTKEGEMGQTDWLATSPRATNRRLGALRGRKPQR